MEDNSTNKNNSKTGCTIGIIIVILFLWSLNGIDITDNGFKYSPIDGIAKNIEALLLIIGAIAVLAFIINRKN